MTPATLVRWTTLVASLWASLTYASASDSALPLVVLSPLVLLGWFLGGGAHGRRLPIHQGVLTGAVVAVIGWAGLRVLSEGPTVEVFSESVMLLLAAKLADHRRARDTSQIVALTVFLAIGSILTSNTLLVGLMVLAMVPIGAALVLSFQIAAAAERAVGFGLGAGHAAFERGTGRGRSGLVAAMTVIGLLMSMVIFVLMPRGLGRSAFGQWGGATVGREVGFSDEVQLGTAGLISENQTPVMDVQVIDRSGDTVGSRLEVLYLRGAVLDVYAGGRWTSGPRERERVALRQGTQQLIGSSRRPIDDWDYELRVTVRAAPPGGSPIFTAWQPRRLWLDAPSGLLIDSATGVITRTGQPGKVAYRLQYRDRHFQTPREPQAERPAVSFPSRRVLEYTERVLREAGLEPDPDLRPREQDFAVSRRIEDVLSRFRYSLDIAAPPERVDPIEWFLLERREGHCEYFASAMAAMCRSVGIPARVVTGYVATDFHDLTGHYVVRQSNAHAWVEVQLDGESPTGPLAHWRRFDPTPSADFREIHQPAETFFTDIRRLIDSIECAGVGSVARFDDDARSAIFGTRAPGLNLQDWGGSLIDRLSLGGRRLVARALLSGVVAFGAVLMLGLALVLGWHPLRRAWRRLVARLLGRGASQAAWGDLASPRRRLLRELKRAGAPKPPGVPLLAHVQQHAPAALGADRAADVESAVETLYRARFAGRRPSQAEMARLATVARGPARNGR